jgi:hypothetical protein
MEATFLRQFFPIAGLTTATATATATTADVTAATMLPSLPTVTQAEIEDALSQLAMSGTVGVDSFSGGLLKLCWKSDMFCTQLTHLYTTCLQQGAFP